MIAIKKEPVMVALLCLALTLAAIIFRPAMPIDETRYLSVAWEMFLKHNYFLPTLNFEPYHHKPPLLFWLLNLSWEIFGVSRAAAVTALSLISSLCIFLLCALARILFPGRAALHERLPWIMVGSVPFLTFGTIVMFDFLLALCAMLTLVFAIRFLKTQDFKYTIPAGLFLGAGVLAKGPVVILFTLLPLALAPSWSNEIVSRKQYYRGLLAMFVIALAPVLFWLIPVYLGTSWEFFEWLVFRQTSERVTGSFGGAHAEPFWFYVPYFITLFVPWLMVPTFWMRLRNLKSEWKNDDVLRFCVLTIFPALLVFTCISGKQIHYLVPISLFVMVLIAHCLENFSLRWIQGIAITMVTFMVVGQGVASFTFFPRYNLQPVADVMMAHPDSDWVWAPNYHGEMNFLARVKKPVTALDDMGQLPGWFAEHPGGLAVVRHHDTEELRPYNLLFKQGYSRSKTISVIENAPENP